MDSDLEKNLHVVFNPNKSIWGILSKQKTVQMFRNTVHWPFRRFKSVIFNIIFNFLKDPMLDRKTGDFTAASTNFIILL